MSRIKNSICWALLLSPALLLCGVGTCLGTTRVVPDEFETIQAALIQSSNLDTVRVHPGIYTEAVKFPVANVKLLGDFIFSGDSADLWLTIIDASAFSAADTSACITIAQGNSRETEVAGFVLQGGRGTMYVEGEFHVKGGGGAHVNMSSPTLISNVFRQDSGYGAAIFSFASSLLVSHNVFYDNDSYPSSGLCVIKASSDDGTPVVFEWNDIRQNTGMSPAHISVSYAQFQFRYNWFHDYVCTRNRAVTILMGVATFEGNTFERIVSEPVDNYMVYLDQNVRVIQDNVFRDCVLAGNCAVLIQSTGTGPIQEISRNYFENLVVDSCANGAGINEQHSSARIHDNVFINCVSANTAALWLPLAANYCDLLVTRNLFRSNRAERPGGAGAILVHPSGQYGETHGTFVVRDNWFEGNSPVAVSQLGDEDLTWNLTNNYWGDPTGPYHPIENPTGRGDTVPVACHITPWLTSPPDLSVPVPKRGTAVPSTWSLEEVYPNPFNPSVNIRLTAVNPVPMQVTVYDVRGRKVKDLWRGVVPTQGEVALMWDGRGAAGPVASGVYFISAHTRDATRQVQTRKAILVR